MNSESVLPLPLDQADTSERKQQQPIQKSSPPHAQIISPRTPLLSSVRPDGKPRPKRRPSQQRAHTLPRLANDVLDRPNLRSLHNLRKLLKESAAKTVSASDSKLPIMRLQRNAGAGNESESEAEQATETDKKKNMKLADVKVLPNGRKCFTFVDQTKMKEYGWVDRIVKTSKYGWPVYDPSSDPHMRPDLKEKFKSIDALSEAEHEFVASKERKRALRKFVQETKMEKNRLTRKVLETAHVEHDDKERLPDAPVFVSLQLSAYRQLTVNWRQAMHDPAPVTRFEVHFSRNESFSSIDHELVVPPSESKVTLQLDEDSPVYDNMLMYSRVVAHNTVGAGPQVFANHGKAIRILSRDQYQPPEAGLPPLVSQVTAFSVKVSWQPPKSGGLSIIKYEVVQQAGGIGAYTPCDPQPEDAATEVVVRNLLHATLYCFRVRAANGIGLGPYSKESKPVWTLPTVPDAPEQPHVGRPTKNSLVVSWKAPANGGAAIIKYRLLQQEEGNEPWVPCSKQPDGTSCLQLLVASLQPATVYRFRLQAHNKYGAGRYSVASEPVRTLYEVPVAPGAPAASRPTSDSLRVQWQPCTSVGSFMSYSLQMKTADGKKWALAPTQPEGNTCEVVVSGLHYNTSYVFRVQAVNDAGPGTFSLTSLAESTLPQRPNAPGELTVGTVKPTSVRLSWAPVIDGGAAVKKYTVMACVEGESTWVSTSVTPTAITGAPIHTTLHSLKVARKYLFKVSATNRVGTSDFGPVLAVTTACSVPEPPLNVKALSSTPHTINVRWEQEFDGGQPIISYSLFYLSLGQQSWTPARPQPAGAVTELTVCDLSPNTSYSFKVSATNAIGAGEFSMFSEPFMTQKTEPDVPFAPTVVACSCDTMSLEWMEPPTGGCDIQCYTLLQAVQGTNDWTASVPQPGANLFVTVTDLLPVTAYVFKLSCTNEVGTTAFGATSAAATTGASVPSQPLPPAANNPTPGTLRVSWTEPLDGGSTITGYILKQRVSGTEEWVSTTPQPTASNTSAVVTSLLPVSLYEFCVVAVNTLGSSTISLPSEPVCTAPTEPAVPGAPVLASATSFSLTLTWQPPFDGGSPLTQFGVQLLAEGEKDWIQPEQQPTSADCTFTIEGLTAATDYKCRICALNAVGRSKYGPSSAICRTKAKCADAPEPPVALSATSSSLLVSWTAPADGGSDIFAYELMQSCDGGETWELSTPQPVDREANVVALLSSTAYIFKVAALNAVGTSPWSQPSEAAFTLERVPELPTAPLSVKTGSVTASTVELTWRPPADNGGCPITGYLVFQLDTEEQSWHVCSSQPAGAELRLVVEELLDATDFQFAVLARNKAGDGPQSEPSPLVRTLQRAKEAIPEITGYEATVAGYDDVARLNDDAAATAKYFTSFKPSPGPHDGDPSKGWHVHLCYDILQEVSGKRGKDRYTSAMSKLISAEEGPLQVLHTSRDRRLVLTIQSAESEFFPRRCTGLYFGNPVTAAAYPADIDSRRQVYMDMMAGEVRSMPVLSAKPGENANQLVVVADWRAYPGEELPLTLGNDILLVAFYFMLEFEGYTTIFPVKSLLAAKVIDDANSQAQQEMMAKFKNAKSVVPQGSYQMSTQEPQRAITRGTLTVTLVKGRDLEAKDWGGTSDPYITLSVGTASTLAKPSMTPRSSVRSTVIKKTLNPEWNEKFTFAVLDAQVQRLCLLAHDKDTIGKDDFMGSAEIRVSKVAFRENPSEILVQEVALTGAVHGRILLEMSFLAAR